MNDLKELLFSACKDAESAQKVPEIALESCAVYEALSDIIERAGLTAEYLNWAGKANR